MKAFLVKAVNSWVTSAGGAIVGLPMLWAGLQPIFDNDPATVADWKVVLAGAGALILGLFARDHTKALIGPPSA